jgi:hypothetical protein
VLTSLFIPEAPSGGEASLKQSLLTSIDTGITNQISDFGGPCDNYLGSGAPVPANQRIGMDCRNTSLTQVPAILKPGSVRAALLMKMIYALMGPSSGEMPLRNIIALTRTTPYTSLNINTVSAPSSDDLRHLFSLIYPGTEPDAGTISQAVAYSDAMAQQFNAKEAWRYSTILFISSLVWQIP